MDQNISTLFDKLIRGDRVALGQAMTLVESERAEDRNRAIDLLILCEEKLRVHDPSIRFAISGAPGVGKSTLIEALGLKAISKGYKVGVITIDPTSSLSHGSILGDKSRMSGLSTNTSAFIRSSPAGSVLGGMGRRSYEMITLLAAVGYDLIFIETVGVGQSEHTAWQITDGFILVVQPGGGDELQGIKRGITELADMVIVNKADGALAPLANLSKQQYQNALHFFSPLRPGWEPKITTCSAQEGTGIDNVLEFIRLYQDIRLKNTSATEERKRQETFWLNWSLGITAHQLLMNHPVVKEKFKNAFNPANPESVSVFKTAFEIENLMKLLIDPINLKSES
ncbi:MAG TPA: methylmalonyl Co-A mutase-associated GTPase MeaB [Saprospiraceae bacterium]|nr:methylmalonyl Co-A mutase-associated GTPase MeaB [Saprospiraceae bacterium]